MKNCIVPPIEPSDKLSLPVAEGVKSGDFVLVGDQGLFGVAATARGAGGNVATNATVWMGGVYDLPVTTSTAADIGDLVYATSAGVLTPASSGNTAVGWFVQAKGAAAATVRIKLKKV